MKNYSFYLLTFGLFFLLGLSSCSKDDDDSTGSMETTRMEAKINGQLITFDTVNTSVAATLVLQGKPYNGFVPGIALAIRQGQSEGDHLFAVTGEQETAQYTEIVNGVTNVYIAKSGTLTITEHRVNEYIKGEFNFVGEHTGGTQPDVVVTDGEFEGFY